MYYYGESVDQNYETARGWYKKSAAQGNATAQFKLGYLYDTGKGVEQNYETAIYFYEKAAEQGLADAQYNLGIIYANGEGVAQNYETAKGWYEKAAKHGNKDAQDRLKEIKEQETLAADICKNAPDPKECHDGLDILGRLFEKALTAEHQ